MWPCDIATGVDENLLCGPLDMLMRWLDVDGEKPRSDDVEGNRLLYSHVDTILSKFTVMSKLLGILLRDMNIYEVVP